MATAIPPLRFDPDGLFVRGTGVSPELVELVHPQLEAARTALLGGEQADIELVDEPDRIVAEYRAHRQRSELGRVLATARRLAEEVDRIVVVAGKSSLLAPRALFGACCHPYHNELSRAERGGQPQMYFAGDSLDNDRLAGLLDLVGHPPNPAGPQGSWALILIEDPVESPALGAARGALLTALKKSTGGDAERFNRRCVSICQRGGRSEQFAQEFVGDRFETAAGAGGRHSVFNATGLLPAAVLGIDVRRLLEGAVRLNEQFRDLPAAGNVVLRYVGACHLMRDQTRPWTPALIAWADGLSSLVRWQEGLPSATRRSHAERTFPLNLLVDEVCRDRISINSNHDGNAIESLPDGLASAAHADRQRAANSRQPWAALHLPRLDAPSIGQLFQLFTLAELLSARLPTVTQSSSSPVPSPQPLFLK